MDATSNADHVAVPLDLANAILNYLADRPFRETSEMISKLHGCSPVSVSQKETDGATSEGLNVD